MSDAQSALKPKMILTRERRQTENSQYYEEDEACLYGSRITDWK